MKKPKNIHRNPNNTKTNRRCCWYSRYIFKIAMMAIKMGNHSSAFRLMAMCCFIEYSVEHPDFENDFKILEDIASQLGYNNDKYDSIINEVIESFNNDGGVALIIEAFK